MRLQDLFEKRSNPELNPKIAPLDQLRRLIKQHGDDLYISFTQGFGRNQYPKLGINPKSTFNTPLGIYCYKAKLVLDQTEAEQDQIRMYGDDNGGLTAPFTGNGAWHNAWVFRLDDSKALRAPMGVGNYARAVETLQTMWKGDPQDFFYFVEEAEQTASERKHIWYFWNASRKMAGHLSSKMSPKISVWNQVMRKCGYTMAEDNGDGWIHANEPEQTVIFDPRIIKPVDVIRRAEGRSILHYGMNKRADKDPLLILRLPPAAVNRLASPMALVILDNYFSNAQDYGVTPDPKVGISFIDNLQTEVVADISATLANSINNTMALVGWHGVFKTRSYVRINRQGIHMLLHPELRHYKIDADLSNKIVKLFRRDSALGSADHQDYNMAESVIQLLKEPDRFDDFQQFVTMFSARDTLVGRYLEASKIAYSLISYRG